MILVLVSVGYGWQSKYCQVGALIFPVILFCTHWRLAQLEGQGLAVVLLKAKSSTQDNRTPTHSYSYTSRDFTISVVYQLLLIIPGPLNLPLGMKKSHPRKKNPQSVTAIQDFNCDVWVTKSFDTNTKLAHIYYNLNRAYNLHPLQGSN